MFASTSNLLRVLCRTATRVSAAVLAVGLAAGLALAEPLSAQALQPHVPPTMAVLEAAGRTQDYTATQLRRFRRDGNVITVRERVEVRANGTLQPDYKLTFLSVVGEPPGSPVEREWRATYEKYAGVLFRHGTFRIRDEVRARQNYTLHDFGPAVLAGRPARCVVVFPNGSDKAVWLIYVDEATAVPLYVAEFDRSVRLFAEIEVEQFSTTVLGPPKAASSASSVLLTSHSFSAAKSYFKASDEIYNPDVSAAPEFELDLVEVRDEPLNGRRKLVLSYSDGIDEFVVVQMPGTRNPFAGVAGQVASGGMPTIARFHDPALTAMTFWDERVSFHVAGRGSMARLDEVALSVYRQALAH